MKPGWPRTRVWMLPSSVRHLTPERRMPDPAMNTELALNKPIPILG